MSAKLLQLKEKMNQLKVAVKNQNFFMLWSAVAGSDYPATALHSTKSVVFDFFTATFYLFLTFAYSYSTAIVALYLKFIH